METRIVKAPLSPPSTPLHPPSGTMTACSENGRTPFASGGDGMSFVLLLGDLEAVGSELTGTGETAHVRDPKQ